MGRKGNGYEDAGSRGGAVVTRRDQLERSERRVSRDLEQGGRRFLVERCREMTPLALVLIEDVMTGEGHETKDRLAAAKLVLEHGYGKPPSTRERPSESGVTIVVQRFSEPQAAVLEAEVMPRTVVTELDDGTPVEGTG